MMARDLPSGTVTLLFTDIEGSTRLLKELGPEGYSRSLAEHRRVVREAVARHQGVEVDTQGDAFFCAFPTAHGAVRAAREALEALEAHPILVRMGLHTGTPHLDKEGYVGEDVHKGARIAAVGHGGQVLLSKETRELVETDVLDLGEHRLKDFDEAVWIFQVGTERFPPLKTISNTNLPRPASSFVGREREVGEVVSLLRDGARLLTLTGPGGSGKTRLAIEAAAELVPEHRNGVFWVELAPVRDPALVAEEVAKTVGAKDGLAEHIGVREMLLVLDNLEQVVEAAPELSTLVEACPKLRLLVTSRELLRVRGEVEYAVPSLAQPEAVELFCTRSRLEADETVAELCGRLDNLPLAVELAAARTSVLSPAQILERLAKRLDLLKGGRDADPRQATLRATIEWSYELLGDEERRLFARMAVFAGGCTLETAEEVADADLDTLQSLVDKSLVRLTDGRFWMLETIREFAEESLEESSEAEELRRRHANHYLALAEEAEPRLLGAGSDEWHDRLEREHDNFRVALDLLESAGDIELALRLAGALAEFWDQRAHHLEGRRRFERLLDGDERPTAARAKALDGASMLASKSGDLSTARPWAEEALALHRMLGNAWGMGISLWQLGYLDAEEGDFATAEQLLDESVRLLGKVGDEASLMWANRTLAFTFYRSGDLERARQLYEDNLLRARTLQDEHLQAASLGALSKIALDEGRLDDAISISLESLRMFQDVSDVPLKMSGICSSAGVLASRGKPAIAAQLLSYSEGLYEEIGVKEPWVDTLNKETLTTIRGQLDDAVLAVAWEEGRKLTADEAVALAMESLK
jgi:predicted ATPase